MQAKLLGAVDTVTSVAQAGDDVAVLVQVVVLSAQVDVNIGVSLVQGLNAFRSSDQTDELDALCAVLLDLGDGVDGAAAGSQHGIQHQNVTLGDILRAGMGMLDGMLTLLPAAKVGFIGLLGAPEGIKALHEANPDVDIYLGAQDDRLNENGYIVLGLGDAGDRIYGTSANLGAVLK